MTPLFRPEDRVPVVSAGADEPATVFAAPPGVPFGEAWPRVAIRERRRDIEAGGKRWRVAAPLPVHEDIKTGHGDLLKASAYFRMTLRRLAGQGVTTVVYDFTPASGWSDEDLSSADIRVVRARYEGVGPAELAANLRRFLESILVTATVLGIGLALLPDDPESPALGLPRIASTPEQLAAILGMVEMPANGLCFWPASFGGRSDGELAALARRFAPRIHAARLDDGEHPAVARVLAEERERRRAQGCADWRLPMSSAPGRAVAAALEFSPGGAA